MNNLKWSFTNIWNESLEQREQRELKPRNRIWASELGGAYIDRFLKMKGEPQTNPPNARSLRKFEAGNMMEWIIEMVLKRAGILQESQKWIQYQYDGLLPVTGKLDFYAGGLPDWNEAIKKIEALDLPEFFKRATHQIIEHLKSYNKELEKIIIEVKSCSSFMYDRYEKYGLESSKNHVMQTFHYLKADKMPEAHLTYICKDDLRMLEFGIFNPSRYEDWYKEDIEKMTVYYNSDIQPPLEPEAIYNEYTAKFSTNWKITYSSYLSRLYHYKEPMEYEEKYQKKIAPWNRVLGRCIRQDKMTELNLMVIKDIKQLFPNFDSLILEAKKRGIKEEEHEME